MNGMCLPHLIAFYNKMGAKLKKTRAKKNNTKTKDMTGMNQMEKTFDKGDLKKAQDILEKQKGRGFTNTEDYWMDLVEFNDLRPWTKKPEEVKNQETEEKRQ